MVGMRAINRCKDAMRDRIPSPTNNFVNSLAADSLEDIERDFNNYRHFNSTLRETLRLILL